MLVVRALVGCGHTPAVLLATPAVRLGDTARRQTELRARQTLSRLPLDIRASWLCRAQVPPGILGIGFSPLTTVLVEPGAMVGLSLHNYFARPAVASRQLCAVGFTSALDPLDLRRALQLVRELCSGLSQR